MQETYVEQRNWFERTFLDWELPWWISPLLYSIIMFCWLLCFYVTLLYGVKFSDDQV